MFVTSYTAKFYHDDFGQFSQNLLPVYIRRHMYIRWYSSTFNLIMIIIFLLISSVLSIIHFEFYRYSSWWLWFLRRLFLLLLLLRDVSIVQFSDRVRTHPQWFDFHGKSWGQEPSNYSNFICNFSFISNFFSSYFSMSILIIYISISDIFSTSWFPIDCEKV